MLHEQSDQRAPVMKVPSLRPAITIVLVLLFVLLGAREINRPFSGLHSWDQAQDAWSARSILKYGFGYTKGLTTMAVGNPPPAVPPWYLDHPQLPPVLDAGAMALFGQNEAALRLASLIVTAASLPFLLALLRRLYDEETALLATFLFIVFPITSYFNYSYSCWILPSILAAYWCYSSLLENFDRATPPGRRQLVGLGAALFVMPQLFWNGLFYDAAIGSHYLLHCLAKRRRPDRSLLLTIVSSSGMSAVAAFGLLIYARGGWRSLLGVYMWRAQAAGEPGRTHLGWFVRQWEMLQNNFTLPVVLIVGAYLAYRTLAHLRERQAGVEGMDPPERPSRAFVHAWIFVAPSILGWIVFSESFWVHNHEYKWFALPVAVAAALGILKLRDALLPRGRILANAATLALLLVVCGFAARGIDSYFGTRTWPMAELEMFKNLNSRMAPDETLLTYEGYWTAESPHKISYIRPEIAWYLDRNIAGAMTLEDVARDAATGKCPFYVVALKLAPPAFVEQLKARYPWELVPVRRSQAEPEAFDEGDQMIFDLRGEDALVSAGLAGLFRDHDASEAARYFRMVLTRNPEHYGANFQLARALDLMGARAEAQPFWQKTLALSARYHDPQTAVIVRQRLAQGP